MSQVYLLTGKPRVGKTTALKKIIDGIGRNRCGGFYTEEQRFRGERCGFRMVDLYDGSSSIIADVALDSECRVGRYGLDLAAMERVGLAALSYAWRSNDFIVIDEIGPMQILSAKLRVWIGGAFEEPCSKLIIGTIASTSDDPFLVELRQRDGVRLFPVTIDNRDTIPQVFLDAIKGE